MLAHHYLSALEYGTADSELVERARVALRTAGERALALASYPAAARFFEAALDRWPDDDPDRVWLLARLGRARFGTDRTGGELLQAAVDQLESRGDLDGAAQVTVELAHVLWVTCNSDAAAAAGDRALALTRGRERSRARAYALVERAAQHMHASEHAEAISILPEALTLTSELGMDELRVRVLDLLGASRGYGGDPSGLEDARRAIALARELNAFSRLIVAELNLRCLHFFFGELSAARELRRTVQRDVEAGGSEDQRRWFSVAKAGEDMLDGRWDEAKTNMGNLIADIDAGGAAYYLDAGALVIRAMISLARGELEVASADTEKALQRARKVRDPQILAQVLLIRATVLLAQDRRDDAASLATELLGRGSVFVVALLELAPSATPIELAWLVRDLGMEDQLARALAPTPPNPWFESAAAIARGEFEKAIKLVVGLDAPSVEAYTRLRAAQEMAAGRSSEAVPLLQPALAFYRSVGASRYIAQAERLMAAKTV
jgi:tetratricopeptide (TPR) repeat protein